MSSAGVRVPLVDWQALEGIGGIATAIAVVVALAFGIAQVRLMAAQRRDLAATQVLAQMTGPDVLDALDRVLALDSDTPAHTIRSDPDLRKAVMMLDFRYEIAGTMVYDRTISLHAVDRYMGGVCRETWKRVRPYIEAERARLGNPSMGEWFQWLVERMDEDPAPGKREGAHVAYRGWRR